MADQSAATYPAGKYYDKELVVRRDGREAYVIYERKPDGKLVMVACPSCYARLRRTLQTLGLPVPTELLQPGDLPV